jgi:hypothetical protein
VGPPPRLNRHPVAVACAAVMGMGGAGGRRAARRRRMVASLVVLALVLVAGATVLSLALG